MPSVIAYDEIEALALRLSVADRYRLAERLLGFSEDNSTEPEREGSIMDLEGIAPGLLGGEDAQEWVKRVRRGDDLSMTPAAKERP